MVSFLIKEQSKSRLVQSKTYRSPRKKIVIKTQHDQNPMAKVKVKYDDLRSPSRKGSLCKEGSQKGNLNKEGSRKGQMNNLDHNKRVDDIMIPHRPGIESSNDINSEYKLDNETSPNHKKKKPTGSVGKKATVASKIVVGCSH
jgi:hypothetical protein